MPTPAISGGAPAEMPEAAAATISRVAPGPADAALSLLLGLFGDTLQTAIEAQDAEQPAELTDHDPSLLLGALATVQVAPPPSTPAPFIPTLSFGFLGQAPAADAIDAESPKQSEALVELAAPPEPAPAPEVAFEIRMTPDAPATDPAPPVPSEPAAKSSAKVIAVEQPKPADEQKSEPAAESASTRSYAMPQAAEPPTAGAAPRKAEVQVVQRLNEVRVVDDVKAPPASVREIVWSLKGPDSTNAHVRLTERAGEVLITVRTPNQELAPALRSGLGDLVQKLHSEGMQVEAWHPRTVESQRAADVRNEAGSDGPADHPSQSQPNYERHRRNSNRNAAFELDDPAAQE